MVRYIVAYFLRLVTTLAILLIVTALLYPYGRIWKGVLEKDERYGVFELVVATLLYLLIVWGIWERLTP